MQISSSLTRRSLVGLAAAVLAWSAQAQQTNPQAEPLAKAVPAGTRLVVAEQNSQASIPWKLAGVDKGVPYQVSFANFNGGPAVLEALISGGVDIGYIGEAPLPIAVSNGVKDLVAVGLYANPGSPANYYLAVQPHSGIRTVADLKGRSVAYPPGTGRHMVLASILHEAGLTLGKDVKAVQLAGSEVAPTFASRSVDAAILLGGQYFKVGAPPSIGDGRGHNWGLNVVLARKSTLDNPAKSAAIADFLRRAVQFNNWTRRNPEAWIQATYVQQQGLTPAQGKQLVDEAGFGTFYPVDKDLVTVFQQVSDGLFDTGALKGKVDIAPYVDARFNTVIAEQNKADGVTPRPLFGAHAAAKATKR